MRSATTRANRVRRGFGCMEVMVDLRKIRTEKERGRGKDDERCKANETVTSAAWYRRHARFGPLIAGQLYAGPRRVRQWPDDENPQPTRRGYQSASCRLPIADPCAPTSWQEKSRDHHTLESPSFSRAWAFLLNVLFRPQNCAWRFSALRRVRTTRWRSRLRTAG